MMHRITKSMGLSLLLASAAGAQVPVDQLLKPPADAQHYLITSTGGQHGESWLWRDAQGRLLGRESMNLRGQVWETDVAETLDAAGIPTAITIRGKTPQGDAAESFAASGGTATWQSQVDKGSGPAGGYYASMGGPMATNASFIETLLKAPGRRLAMLPGGTAQARELTRVTVNGQELLCWAVTGLSNTPVPIWTWPDGRFFGVSFGLSWLPAGWEGQRAALEAAQTKALAAEMPRLARTLASMPKGPVAFTHVQTFDALGLAFRPDQTVVVTGGTITAAGPAANVKVPAGAQVIDGKGKTLLPGLWDVHMHVGDDYTGMQELSLGVTSVRDPGNDDDRTIDRRDRASRGELLLPNVYPSSLIDGKGPYTAQVANVATSQDEAVALVQKAKAKGFIGVKFYGTFNPAWLPAAIAEAHKLGLHVHGHIPAGIRPSAAIAAGYDEITHINWIAMEGVPASVLPTDNGIDRFMAPGRYAKDFDLTSGPMAAIVASMAQKHIYSDPTMVAFESLYVPENGDLSPSYAPYVGTLPPLVERGFRSGGFAVPPDLTRADFRKSWAKMVELLGRMHKAGVPIAAGTDGSGIEIIHELEIYQQAGFTPAEAIAAATIVPARLVKADARTGSITPGKVADLVLVEGDPSRNIGALRQTRLVMQGGRLMDADALRSAVGIGGRPK
jgi:imidazolonepropionase-like amidohydrolase